jgi:hypothetical protein
VGAKRYAYVLTATVDTKQTGWACTSSSWPRAFSRFYEDWPMLTAPTPDLTETRLTRAPRPRV